MFPSTTRQIRMQESSPYWLALQELSVKYRPLPYIPVSRARAVRIPCSLMPDTYKHVRARGE